ncbi:MAG: hypothetical protein FJ100_15635 [Deltaproteobacteria bacterium]|nr:hypothetical protein [Deltaproteobacteria bacterium]
MTSPFRFLVPSRAAGVPTKAVLSAFALLLALPLLGACEKGEKSCRYYSMVLDAKGATLRKRADALETIKSIPYRDVHKCDDQHVFDRLGRAMDTKELRPLVIATVESIGRSSKGLRDKAEKLLIKALGFEDIAGQAAVTVRTWRIESAESGRDPYFPSKPVIQALADKVKKYKKETKALLVEALFVSLVTNEQRMEYEDLLIDLALTDPADQGLDTNLKALMYLTEIYRAVPGQPVKDWAQGTGPKAFDAFVKALYTRDAVRAETYMLGRIALGTVDGGVLSKKILAMATQRDPEFEKWAKEYGLSDWEWKEGPKLAQVLADLHDPQTAQDIVAQMGKPIDAATSPGDYEQKMGRSLPYAGYITSRLQLSMWALAAMGEGLAPVADKIAANAKSNGLTVEQRTFGFNALAFSGASNAWPTMFKVFSELPDNEKPDFLVSMSYAIEPENLDDWTKGMVESKAEGVKKFVSDPTIKARVDLVTKCKGAVDAATDDAAKTLALLTCYKGFLTTGDDLAKEKAVIGLIHLGVRKGADVVPLLCDAMTKAQATSSTLRQVAMAGIRQLAQPKHANLVYTTKEFQVSIPNATPWMFDMEVLVSQLLRKPGAVPVGNIAAPGSQVKPEEAATPTAAPPAAPK